MSRNEFDFDEEYPRPSVNHRQVNVNIHIYGPKRSFAGWHFVHCLLTFMTFGLWLPIYILHYVMWSMNR